MFVLTIENCYLKTEPAVILYLESHAEKGINTSSIKSSSAQIWQEVLSPFTGARHTAKTKPDGTTRAVAPLLCNVLVTCSTCSHIKHQIYVYIHIIP